MRRWTRSSGEYRFQMSSTPLLTLQLIELNFTLQLIQLTNKINTLFNNFPLKAIIESQIKCESKRKLMHFRGKEMQIPFSSIGLVLNKSVH